MKKILVLVVMATLVATGSFAGVITGSLHDMQSFGGVNEVCVYCHTPHNATDATAPLWNRNNSSVSLYRSYWG